MFKILLLISNILNILLEKDLTCRNCRCCTFCRNRCHNRRCRKWRRQPAVAMVGAGNGGGNRGSGWGMQQSTNKQAAIVAETAFVVAAVAPEAVVAGAVATAAMSAMAVAQTAAAATGGMWDLN
jgi:hypothetical protein